MFNTTIVLYLYPDVCTQTVYANKVAHVQEKRKPSKSIVFTTLNDN